MCVMVCARGVSGNRVQCARALVIDIVKCDIAVTLGVEIRILIGLYRELHEAPGDVIDVQQEWVVEF